MDSSLQNALVSWVNTFNSAEAITDLTDSRVISGRLLGIITERIFGAGADTCPQNDEECFEYTASGLAEFYQVSGDLLVSVYGISEKSPEEISKTLMLLLSWAVHCQQNEEFIVDIRSLSPEDQHSLMLLINSTMKQFGDGSLASGNFLVGLVCPDAASQIPPADVVSKPGIGEQQSTPGNGEQQSTPPHRSTLAMSLPLQDSPLPPPGGTPARGLAHLDENMPSPASHVTSTISKSKFHARMNPTPTGRHKSSSRSAYSHQQSVHFTPTPTSSHPPSTPSVWSNSKQQSGVWRNSSPALRRWMASPACSMSGSTSSEASDTIQQRMSSVTYALREQIGLREDLEMQLCQTQEQLTKSEASVRDIERQCKVLEARLVEMEDLQHADVELKKTQAKLDRAMKRLESANDMKSHAEHLQDQLNSAHAQLISMETKMAQSSDLTGRVEFYKAQLHGSELRCSSEHARVEQLQSEVEKLSALYGESTSNAAAVTADVARLQGQVEFLQDELEKATGAGSDEGCSQMTMADHAEISRLQQENKELRAVLPSKEEMRLMRSQVEDATEMKKSFENLYVENKRQLLEMADEKSALERQLAGEKEKQRKAQHLLEAERTTSSTIQHQLQISEEGLASSAEENGRISTALTDTCAELKATKVQTSDLQQQLTISRHELQASNDAAANQKEHLLEQLGEVRLQLDTANHVLQETAKKHSALLSSTEAHQEQRKHWQQLVQTANEKNNDLALRLETAGNELGAERERHHAAFVKLQSKYDEVCVDRQSAQQQVAMIKTQLTSSAQEKQEVQDQFNQQQATSADLEARNAQLEQNLGEALDRAQKLQASSSEQVANLQKKLEERDQSSRDLFSVIGQQTAALLQILTGNEWSALDADASASAQQQNIVSLLKHLGQQHTDITDKKTALHVEVEDLRCQLMAVSKQAAEDLATTQQQAAAFMSELNELQASLQQKTETIGLLKAKKKELQQTFEKAELAVKVFEEERSAMQLSQRESLEQRAKILHEAAQLRMQIAEQERLMDKHASEQEKVSCNLQIRGKEVDDLQEQLRIQEQVAEEQQEILVRSQHEHVNQLADKDRAMEGVAAELANARDKLLAAEQERCDAKAELLHARETATTLEASLAESSSRHAEQLDQVTGLRRDAESAAANLHAVRGELAAKNELSEQNSASISALQRRIDSLTEDLSRQQEVAAEQSSSVENSTQQLAKKEGEISQLSATIAQLEARMQRAVGEAEVQSTTLAELQSDLQASQSAHKAIEETVSERDAQFSGLSDDIAERDSQICGLKATLAERDSHLDSLQSQISERDSQLDSLRSQISERDSQLTDVQQATSSNDQQIAHLRSTVESLESKLSAQEEELSANRVTMATLQQASDMSSDSATAVAERLAARAAEIEELRATLESARQQNKHLASDLSAVNTERETLAEQQKQDQGVLEQDRQQLSAQNAALKTDADVLQSEVRKLRAQCEQLGAEKRVDSAAAMQLVTVQDEYTALQRRHGHIAGELEQRQLELEQHRQQLADSHQSEKEAKTYAEQASSNYRSLQQEMEELVQRYQDSSSAAKATCHAVMEEARKRDEDAAAQHQELTDRLEHANERVHHYEHMTTTLERQLQLAAQQIQSLQQRTGPPSSSSQSSGTSFRQMMQPGYESVHAEFDKGRVSPSHIEKLHSPDGQLEGDISSFLAGTDKKRTSTQASGKTSGCSSSRRTTVTTSSMPPFAWGDGNDSANQESDDDDLDEDRLRELHRRNTLAPSHLKSTYPVELQAADNKANAARKRTASASSSRPSSTSTSHRAPGRLSAMPSVAEDRPASMPAPAPVQSFSMEVSPPRKTSRKRAAPPQIVAKKRASVTQDEEEDESAKRRQTFLIASPKPKENVNTAKSRTAGQSTSALARSGKNEKVSAAETEAAGDNLGVSTEVPASKLPAHLAARMASYQQKADSKAAAAAAAAAAAEAKTARSSSKKSRPLAHRNKA